MTGLNTKEDQIIDLLTATNAKLDAILDALGAPPPTSTVTLANVLTVLNHIDATLGDPEQSVFTIWNLLGEIPPVLGQINDHIGFPTGDATTTALGRLAAIERLSRCSCPPEAPDLTDPDAPCTEPFTSEPDRVLAATSYPGRVFARWPLPLPDGITEGHFLDPAIPGGEIVRSSDIEGWFLYVQSSASHFSLNPTSNDLDITNAWINIDVRSEEIAISVDAGFTLTAYICVPGGTVEPPPDCVTFTSQLMNLDNDPGNYHIERHAIEWPDTFTRQHNQEDFVYSGWAVAVGNFIGYRLRRVSGTNARLVARKLDGSYLIEMLNETLYTINEGTQFILVDAYNSEADEFSIEFCIPVES
jgi:hypothetical protein